MVISELVSKCRDVIGDSSDSAYLDAKVIVKEVLSLTDTELVVKKFDDVPETLAEKAVGMAELRKTHMPLSYIIGSREFMSMNFAVNESTLIPRPDTECVVEKIIEDKPCGKILDIGTGSGAIAVSVASFVENSEVYAMDISEKALATAAENAKQNGVFVKFIHADIFDFKTDTVFDCIVSNPPYIESEVIGTLMSDVKDFEPVSALDGGADGLCFYKRIAEFSKTNLTHGGFLYLEHGYRQFDDVRHILEENNFIDIEKIFDLGGNIRGCKAKLGGNTNEKVHS